MHTARLYLPYIHIQLYIPRILFTTPHSEKSLEPEAHPSGHKIQGHN